MLKIAAGVHIHRRYEKLSIIRKKIQLRVKNSKIIVNELLIPSMESELNAVFNAVTIYANESYMDLCDEQVDYTIISKTGNGVITLST